MSDKLAFADLLPPLHINNTRARAHTHTHTPTVHDARAPPRGVYKMTGSQWFILSRPFVAFLVACLFPSSSPPPSPDATPPPDVTWSRPTNYRGSKGAEGETGGVGDGGSWVEREERRWYGARECEAVDRIDRWARHAFIPGEGL